MPMQEAVLQAEMAVPCLEGNALSDLESQWTARTGHDLKSSMLELARALRGLTYYPQTDPQREPLLDRAFRAIEADLLRSGDLELELGEESIQVMGLSAPLELEGVAAEFGTALRQHGLHRVRLDPLLSRHALHGLLELLGHDPARYGSAEVFAKQLSAREASGIHLNDFEAVPEPIPQKLSATPPCASASLGAAILIQPTEQPAPNEEDQAAAREAAQEPVALSLEAQPLAFPSTEDRGERLRARLIELDQTPDDAAYGERAADVVRWADDLRRSGLPLEWYRATIVLADHAVGFGGRSESQARAASACFQDLAHGEGLSELIDRACDPRPEAGVRAAQLLLQLGEVAVADVFDRICEAGDPAIVPALPRLILTLGAASLPTLSAAIHGEDPDRARIAIRLAGELQHPGALSVLIDALKEPALDRKLETIRALSLLPGDASKVALEAALESDLDEIVVAATGALATSDGREAVPALLDVLEASVHTTRTTVCIELIDVLGRIGDERAVPRLASILERRPMIRRVHWHAIQLAAVDALVQLPTKEAKRSLERTAENGPRPVRARAQKTLNRLQRRG